jgi:hypothetical protein
VFGREDVALCDHAVERDHLHVQGRQGDRVQSATNGTLQMANPAMPVTGRLNVFSELRARLRAERPLARGIVEEGRMPGAQDRQGQSRDPRKQKKRSSRAPESAAEHGLIPM